MHIALHIRFTGVGMKKLLALGLIFFSYSGFATYVDCKDQIVYLRDLPTNSTTESRERVIESQLTVAQYLGLMPDGVAIFSSNLTQDITTEGLRQTMGAELFTHIQGAFAKGSVSRTLNEDQKNLLFDIGAEKIAVVTGQVPRILGLKEDGAAKTQAQRDLEVLHLIGSYFGATPKENRAVLVSSSSEDLADYANAFPPQCVIYPPDIKEFFNTKLN
jgi:hypothetical protein